jgi:hypothetical protein
MVNDWPDEIRRDDGIEVVSGTSDLIRILARVI